MKSIPIVIQETSGITRLLEPVTIGVPFKKGELFDVSELTLTDNSNSINIQAKKTATWFDGSIKWILLDFQVNQKKNTNKELKLKLKDKDYKSNDFHSLNIKEDENSLFVDTGVYQFTINKHELLPFEQIVNSKQQVILSNKQSSIIFQDRNGGFLNSEIIQIDIDEACPLRTTIKLSGQFVSEDKQCFANFENALTFYAGSSRVKSDIKLHNPRAAKHSKGLWDLGDEHSIYFKQLTSQFLLDKKSLVSYKETLNDGWVETKSSTFQIYQASSGSENWKSTNHLNKDNHIPLDFKGYRCVDNNQLINEGDKASPIINVSSDRLNITVYIKNYWQNFPKAIELSNNSLNISLFPEQFLDGFELQGGESKTHTLFLDFSEDKNSLDNCHSPLHVSLPLNHYAQTQVFPWMPDKYTETAIEKLIQAGINSEDNFFNKREQIDEYGWRNFGELFADHESLYVNKPASDHQEHKLYISHYNNQYDPIYGFARQYVLTGDPKWFELMNDLAQHVVDIDIYQTQEDRNEYNGGLFWHTDHYIDAATCAHRTFSKVHLTDNPHAGGGPGSEHCYSTGLASHYFMTGSLQSKQAVLTLSDWIIKLFEGDGGLFEYALKFKQKELPIVKKLIKRKKVAKHLYPFTRGTGNYITTLIDAYTITEDKTYIHKIEKIISLTLHPKDEISQRNLEDIEISWSYTILLQAISKYLMLKVSIDNYDENFYYARDSLLHYSQWMLENEYPYLEKIEVLEFPNHTWVAQDIRKANILSFAANFNLKQASQYRKKAEFFASYVVDNLKNNETRNFTRILVVLMQNHMDYKPMKNNPKMIKASRVWTDVPQYTLSGVLLKASKEMISRLFTLSIKKEKQWIKNRLTT